MSGTTWASRPETRPAAQTADSSSQTFYYPSVSVFLNQSTGESVQTLEFPASIVFDCESGRYVGRVLALPGCVSEVESPKEAKENLTSALKDILDLHRDRGTRPVLSPPEGEVPPSSLKTIHVQVA
jgi:predicted RNase H-like HicB family nuclease